MSARKITAGDKSSARKRVREFELWDKFFASVIGVATVCLVAAYLFQP